MKRSKNHEPSGRMPHEEFVLLPPLERMKLHVNEMYPLLEPDKSYFKDITRIMQSMIRADTDEELTHKLRFLFPQSEYTGEGLGRMQADAVEVFDCFYDVDITSLRVIQLRRYEAMHARAVELNDMTTAIKALSYIDKLYALTTKTAVPLTRVPQIPKAVRTTDPSVLRNNYRADEEE